MKSVNLLKGLLITLVAFIFVGNAYALNGNMVRDVDGYFMVEDCYDLQAIPSYGLGDNYKLVDEIDCSDTINWNGGAGFDPIGGQYNPFTGNFDGQDFVIVELYINRPSTSYVGLFGRADSGGQISNVGLVDVYVNARTAVGGLVGYTGYGATVSNCYVAGSVRGRNLAGGLIGRNWGGSIADCHVAGNVSGGSPEVGGLAGTNRHGSITRCYSTANVSGGSNTVGGLVGINYLSATLSESYATGDVSGGNQVGALAGWNQGAKIEDCYARGNVTGYGYYAGGVVGINRGSIYNTYGTGNVNGNLYVGGSVGRNEGRLDSSYATGSVSGNSWVGGLVGANFRSVFSSYFTDANNDNGIGTLETGGAEAFFVKSHLVYSRWDFFYLWGIVEYVDYPYFRWEYPEITLAINEIMYNPATWQGSDHYNEYVELYNYGEEPIDASTLLIGDWVENDGLYSYDGGTTVIPAGGYAIITDTDTDVYETFNVDPDAIRLRVEDNAIGRGLGNGGDLVLLSADGFAIERVVYDDTVAWHRYNADGYGASLQKIDPLADPQDPDNWCGYLLSPGRATSCVMVIDIDIDPDTLNLKSNGKWITCYIEIPGEYDYEVDDIEVSTVALTGVDDDIIDPIYAEGPSTIGDNDGDGILDLMVKFDRSEVQAVLEVGEETLTVTGELLDTTPFEGSDTVRVIDEGKK